MNMLTRSSEWIFNPLRYTGLCIRIYDLYLFGVLYFTYIGISTPSVPGYINITNSRDHGKFQN